MTDVEIDEASAIIRTALTILASTAIGRPVGVELSEMRLRIGLLDAELEDVIADNEIAARLLEVFTNVYQTKPSLGRAEHFVVLMLREAPVTVFAQYTQDLVIRYGLAFMSRVLADTAFKNRDEAEAIVVRVAPLFESAIIRAADVGDISSYQRLLALHSAVVRDATERGRLLARIVKYEFGFRRPSLAIANYLYGDASREAEIVSENNPVHPAFMLPSGRALSK